MHSHFNLFLALLLVKMLSLPLAFLQPLALQQPVVCQVCWVEAGHHQFKNSTWNEREFW